MFSDICKEFTCDNGGTTECKNGVPSCFCPQNYTGQYCETGTSLLVRWNISFRINFFKCRTMLFCSIQKIIEPFANVTAVLLNKILLTLIFFIRDCYTPPSWLPIHCCLIPKGTLRICPVIHEHYYETLITKENLRKKQET